MPKFSNLSKTILFLFALNMITNCASARGIPTKFVEEIKTIESPRMSIASIELNQEKTKTHNCLGKFPIGSAYDYNTDNLAVLNNSLKDTITDVNNNTILDGKLQIHVRIRSYQLMVKQSSNAILANVAWAAVDRDRDKVFHEQFYVSETRANNVGTNKDLVHKAIVKRIIGTSVLLRNTDLAKIKKLKFQGTNSNYNDFKRKMPKSCQYWLQQSSTALRGNMADTKAAPKTLVKESIDWDKANKLKPVDWKQLLKK